MHEFDIIARHFRPLASAFPGALGLKDDAALLIPPPGMQIVVTADAVNAGVHFIGNETPELIARKALRVNLSDLSAMGAEPWCYFLTLALPQDTQEHFIARFAEGLAQDQAEFGIHLAGGDTTATHGKLSVSITALGLVPPGAALTRAGAKAGDHVYVSGTLGEAALGLRTLQSPPQCPMPNAQRLIERYLLPSPRIALGMNLRGVANACMDISDGLMQDLSHICSASNLGAELWADRIPIPPMGISLTEAVSAGDDYELLFTAPPDASVPEGCTQIGIMREGAGVKLLDAQGAEINIPQRGYRHF